MPRAAVALSLLFAFLGLAGCEAVSSGVRERFGDFPGKTEIVPGAKRDVYSHAQWVLKRLGFQLSRSGEAQGIVEAFSPIQPGDATRNARQITVELRLSDLGPKETEVTVWLRESLEGGLAIGASGTRQPLREHGLYASIFSQLKKGPVEQEQAPAGPRR